VVVLSLQWRADEFRRSLRLEGFDLDLKCHIHFEAIFLPNGDAKGRVIERADGVGAARAFSTRRYIDRTFE
jgi:hypothetical protein